MKKLNILTALIVVFAFGLVSLNTSCKTPESITNKSGAQLWGENCMRCHNIPPATIYGDDKWDVVGEHMRMKANLTDTEINKIVGFLKSAN